MAQNNLQLCSDNKPTAVDSEEVTPFRTLTTKFLKNSIINVSYIMGQFIEEDLDDKQSSKAIWMFLKSYVVIKKGDV
ncbi:hypothetical protein T4A_7609, partial [Trichinella pseudospiralis]